MIRKITLAAICFIYFLPLFGQQPSHFIDTVAMYFNDAKIAAANHRQLWGKNLYGPLLLADPKTRKVYANYPDLEGQLVKEGPIYLGQLPEKINIANYVVNWAGRDWAMIMMNLLPKNKFERVNLFCHELFHRMQPELGFVTANAVNDHLDKKEGRIYLRLELEALKKALLAKTRTEMKSNIADALTFREYRHSLYPGADTMENILEINEGIAEYTGLIMDGRNKEQAVTKLIQKIDGMVSGDENFVRSFPYRTIPAYGFLLRNHDLYWNKKIKAKTNLTEFFSNAFNIDLPVLSASVIEEMTVRYGGPAIILLETEREQRIERQIVELKKLLIESPHLEIPCEAVKMIANNSAILPVGKDGIIYTSFIRAVDSWGVLEVEAGGVLLSPGRKKISLPLPAETNGNIIKGEKWVLKLNPGYKVETDSGSGNQFVRKE